MFELVEKMAPNAVIKVIGVGGGGGNAVAHMVNSNVEGVEFVCANTDAQAIRGVGAKSILFKEALNLLERQSPGTKQTFLFGFLDEARSAFAGGDPHELRPCIECEQPTTTERCAFCRLLAETRQPKRPSFKGRRRTRRGGGNGPRPAPAARAPEGQADPAPAQA